MESGTAPSSPPRAVDATTLMQALRRTAAEHPEITAVRTPDDDVSLSWSELLRRVDLIAGGLSELGVRRGDCVAIMLGNRPEFHLVDLAAATLGATPFSVYVTYPAAEIRYLLKDSSAKVAIVEQAFLPQMLAAREGLAEPPHVIVVDGEAPAGMSTLANVESACPADFDPVAVAEQIRPDDVLTLIYLPQVRPTWFFAVPRIWEKLKAGLEAMQAAQPEEQRRPVQAALEAATARVRLRQQGKPVPDELEEEVAEADANLFVRIREMLGLDQAVAVNVGAAPTPVSVLEFFHALGIELAELWGLSETCGVGAVNRPGAVRIGTVGPAAPGAELKLAPDGEVLCRGKFMMLGYRNDPERTAEALDAEGWLHTGDIGTIDEDGYLKIVDRKKELIINAAGKNMSPANIEAALKTGSSLIGQACCIGDGRPYNTALIVLDSDFAPQWAKGHGLAGVSLEELAAEPEVRAAVQEGVDQANQELASVEQVKRFTIIHGDWMPGGDELTPTIKLKRKPISQKYEREIEAMYAAER